ncbi:Fork head domain transcription factor slp1 [Gryllus bimaculatus]|nr:Fork head domain transcription factor slp1 [Gryllus bimaculatus]
MMAPERAGPEGAPARERRGPAGRGGRAASARRARAPRAAPSSPLFSMLAHRADQFIWVKNSKASKVKQECSGKKSRLFGDFQRGDDAGAEAGPAAARRAATRMTPRLSPRGRAEGATTTTLTSLTWLQYGNLLRGPSLSTKPADSDRGRLPYHCGSASELAHAQRSKESIVYTLKVVSRCAQLCTTVDKSFPLSRSVESLHVQEGDAAGAEAGAGAAAAAQPPAMTPSPSPAGRPEGADDDDLTSLTWLQDRNLLRGELSAAFVTGSTEMNGCGMGRTAVTHRSHEAEPAHGRVARVADERLRGRREQQRAVGAGRPPPLLHHLVVVVVVLLLLLLVDGARGGGASPSPPPRPALGAPAAAAPPRPRATAQARARGGSRHKHPQNVPYDPMVHVGSKPPYSFSCLIFMAIEDSPQRALPVKEIYSWILEHFPYFKNAPTGWKNSVRHNLSLNKCFRKVEKAPNLGKGSLWMVDPVFRPNLLQALQKAPFHPQSTLERIAAIASSPANSGPLLPRSASVTSDLTPTGRHAGRRLPDPDLFPFLSRRLAASGVDIVPVAGAANDGSTVDDVNSLDDVDAAAAMLALKHGPLMLITRNDVFKPFQGQNGADPKAKKKTRASKNGDANEEMFPVITTSPSEDHTYSAGPTVPLPTPSSYQPPKMFVADWPIAVHCATRPSIVGAADPEEQRKIAEGADALLNLAGITTRKRSHSGEFTMSPPTSEDVTPPPVPKRTIATRGRKRGSSVATNGSAGSTPTRPRALWPASGRVGKRRGTGDNRRGGPGRRRGSVHHNNNNSIHLKPVKTSVSPSLQRNDHELRRPVRSEEKTGRTRR